MKKKSKYIESVIRQNVHEDVWAWLEEKAAEVNKEKNASALNGTFAVIPVKTGNKKLVFMPADRQNKDMNPHELYIADWTTERLCRVWLIMQIDASDKTRYLEKTENLFSGASMNELVALYSALPVLAYPEKWKKRCAEGIRSNIGTVLEAIMYENAYPFNWLDEPAFNQMVLKAFFAEKKVDRIIGLDQRANPELADILIDYAHERWAAGRAVNPQLWRLTGKYIHAGNFSDIQRLWNKGSETEKKAALLACSQSDYALARLLWDNEGNLKKDITEKRLSWHNLEG